MDDLLVRHGFETIAQFGFEELGLRCFPGRDDVRLPGIDRIAIATL